MIRRLLALVSSSVLVAAVLVAAPSPAYASGSGTISNHGGSAPVYSGPGDMHSLLRTVGAGVRVSFHCYVRGQIVTGDYAPSNAWDALDGGGYIADALVYTGSDKPIVGRCPWNEFGSNRFPVAYTGGSGFDPRVSPSRGSAVGAGHLPDGTIVTVTCETTGESVTDSIPYTTNLWDRLDNGTYVSNAFLDTETNGPTPGMGQCTQDPPPQPTQRPTPPGGSTNPTPGTNPPATKQPTTPASFKAHRCTRDRDGKIVDSLSAAPDSEAPAGKSGYKV